MGEERERTLQLTSIDWMIMVLYFIFAIGIGLGVKLGATPLGWLRETETLGEEARSRVCNWGVRIGRTMWFGS